MLCPTLNKSAKQLVQFDPRDADHMEAFRLLCLGEPGPQGIHIRQHPTLRFELEASFPDVRSMLFHKVGEFHRTALLKRKGSKKAVAKVA